MSLVDILAHRTVPTGATDADGHVTFGSVPAGRYDLKVADGGIPAYVASP
ncbi:hypothetical protein AB0F91_09020 [Amycolatopsis sp. NPDC023774]